MTSSELTFSPPIQQPLYLLKRIAISLDEKSTFSATLTLTLVQLPAPGPGRRHETEDGNGATEHCPPLGVHADLGEREPGRGGGAQS